MYTENKINMINWRTQINYHTQRMPNGNTIKWGEKAKNVQGNQFLFYSQEFKRRNMSEKKK